jgi:hypothetical protein
MCATRFSAIRLAAIRLAANFYERGQARGGFERALSEGYVTFIVKSALSKDRG